MAKTPSPQPSEETRTKNLRRVERAKLVARLGEIGSPWAKPAQEAHKEVCVLEDQLQAKRITLMAVLKLAKVI